MYLTRFKLQMIKAAMEVKNSPAEHCYTHIHTQTRQHATHASVERTWNT
jgi:hypothetical protein